MYRSHFWGCFTKYFVKRFKSQNLRNVSKVKLCGRTTHILFSTVERNLFSQSSELKLTSTVGDNEMCFFLNMLAAITGAGITVFCYLFGMITSGIWAFQKQTFNVFNISDGIWDPWSPKLEGCDMKITNSQPNPTSVEFTPPARCIKVHETCWDSFQGTQRVGQCHHKTSLNHFSMTWGLWEVLVNWRLANITSLFKKGSKEDLGNTDLSISVKCLEIWRNYSVNYWKCLKFNAVIDHIQHIYKERYV